MADLWRLVRATAACKADGPTATMRAYERVLRRPQEEDRRRPPARRRQDGGGSRLRGEPLLGLKRYAKLAEEGRPLAPKKRPGLRPKLDGAAERLLEEDLEERPAAATLRQRREFLRRAAGVSVSESAVSRALRRLGFSRKKDRWERQSATSS